MRGAFVTSLSFAVCAVTVAAVPQRLRSPVTLDSTTSFVLDSKFTHETYRIKVYIPRAASPTDGYPTLYLLDGNVLFATFAGAERNESQAGEVEPAVVVGIESGDGPRSADRMYDFTASDLTPHEKNIVVEVGQHARFGGCGAFLRTIQQEVKPSVAQRVHVDAERTALFGWSLGGLLVAHTMLTQPAAFQSYVALSPSLWRSDKQVFSELPGFKAKVPQKKMHPALYLGVGGLEEEAAPGMLRQEAEPKLLAAEMAYAHMRTNAESFDRELGPYFKEHSFRYSFHVFEGDSHNNVPWDAVNPVLQFLFGMP